MTNDGAVSLVERLAIFFRWFDVFLVEMENLQSFPGQILKPYLLKYSTIFVEYSTRFVEYLNMFVEMKNLQYFPAQIFNHICYTFKIFQNYPEKITLRCLKYFLLNLKFYFTVFTCIKNIYWLNYVSSNSQLHNCMDIDTNEDRMSTSGLF